MSRDLLFVAISLFAWGLGEGAFLPFQTLYLEELGANPLKIGAILSGYGIANALAHIPAGYLSDRIGRKPMMVAAWLLGIAATGIMGLATSLNGFVAGMLIYGLTLFVLAPLNSYITAARGSWSVSRALTLVSACFNLGAMAGPWLGGFLGEQYGYRSIFQVATGIFAISSVLVMLVHSQAVESHAAGEKRENLLANRRFLGFVAVLFVVNFALFMPQPLSPNYLQNEHGLNLSQIGSLYFISSVGVVALNLILGQLQPRLGFLISQAAVGLFALLLWQGNSLAVFIPAYFLLGGFRTARSLATAQARSFVHQADMGLAYGLLETFSSFAVILAPLLAGTLYDRNPAWMYAAGAALIAISILASGAYLLAGRKDYVLKQSSS